MAPDLGANSVGEAGLASELNALINDCNQQAANQKHQSLVLNVLT
jgi:hypothetical protein